MTGKEVFRTALQLLGYTDQSGEPDSRRGTEIYKTGLAAVNQMVAELAVAESGELPSPLTSLQQTVPLSEQTTRTVLPYGVAMLLAAASGDSENQRLFATLYDGHRAACRRDYTRRADVLPRGCDA